MDEVEVKTSHSPPVYLHECPGNGRVQSRPGDDELALLVGADSFGYKAYPFPGG